MTVTTREREEEEADSTMVPSGVDDHVLSNDTVACCSKYLKVGRNINPLVGLKLMGLHQIIFGSGGLGFMIYH